ncbi:hypothetical protein FHT21_002184 [Pedobacter sp. SG908]|nr:hypothetical protein [Pedobacter sp. SG908]
MNFFFKNKISIMLSKKIFYNDLSTEVSTENIGPLDGFNISDLDYSLIY